MLSSLFPLLPMLPNRVRTMGHPHTLTWLDVAPGLLRTEWQHRGQPCRGAHCLHVQEAAGDIDVVKIVPVQVTVPIP